MKALAKTDDFPIKHRGNVHNGKVRSVYWLTADDSRRLIEEKGYDINSATNLGVMIISDRISAFDVPWKAEGLDGVPGKGAALNATSEHWFDVYKEAGLAGNHLVDKPHPSVWIVQQAEPILVEAIARQYITGSMWRAYEEGERELYGYTLPDGLKKDQRLEQLLITPTTKGAIPSVKGWEGGDDTPITKEDIIKHHGLLGFDSVPDVNHYEDLTREGFSIISDGYSTIGERFVDTKFELGYIFDKDGRLHMIFIDEVGTPDSSRCWDSVQYEKGIVVDNSKEYFRKALFDDPQIPNEVLKNKDLMETRKQIAKDYRVNPDIFMMVSQRYVDLAERLTDHEIMPSDNPREEITDALNAYGLIK